jgi:hypothetical protein
MSNPKNKTQKSFVDGILARLTGDSKEALAGKISRKVESAIKGQISALESKVVDDENRVEDAQEAFNNALYPTSLPTSNEIYCSSLVRAQSDLDSANESLENTKKSIVFFQGLLKAE